MVFSTDMPPVPELSAKLIFPTKEIVEEYYLPIIYTACRTCYSEQLPDQIWDKAVSRQVADEKQQNLVRKVMESGHGSTIEHVNFTFAISGVTRTLSHQLVRHRAGTAFDQQSQRYVSFKARDNYTVPDSIANGDLPDDLAGQFRQAIDDNLALYGQLLQAEVPAEDARFIFPNAMQTNLIMTVNLRQLIHMSGLRLCTMAQWEIRQMFKQIRHEIFRVSPFFGSFLAPKCIPLGYCDEMGNRDEHCRIRPHRDTVMAVWEAYRGGELTGDRWTGRTRDRPRSGRARAARRFRSPPTTSCRSIPWRWPASPLETPTGSRATSALVVGRDAVPQGESAQLVLRLVRRALGFRDEESVHLARVHEQQRVPPLVAVQHDPIVAMEADRPVGLQLDQRRQQHLLVEGPVQEGGVQPGQHIAQLQGGVPRQARQQVDDAQPRERVAAARDLRGRELRIGHAVRWRGERGGGGRLGHRSDGV